MNNLEVVKAWNNLDNDEKLEVIEQGLAILFDADHDFEEEDAEVILNWMNEQL